MARRAALLRLDRYALRGHADLELIEFDEIRFFVDLVTFFARGVRRRFPTYAMQVDTIAALCRCMLVRAAKRKNAS